MIRSAYTQFVYVVGGADHDQMEKMRKSLSEMVTGWDVATVKEIVADTLHNVVDPLVYEEAVPPSSSTMPRATTSSSSPPPAPSWSSRSARCSAPTTSSPPR